MADANDIGQKAVDAYNKSINQPSTYNAPDQGSGPSSGPDRGNPVYGTHKEGNLVVQDTAPINRTFASDMAAQQRNEQMSSAEASKNKKSLDAYSAIGTNVQYTRAKNAVGKPAPKPRKGK